MIIFEETAASDGLHVITGMLIVGLIFLAVIGIGELVRRAGHRH
jgi:hypothetical protein